MMKKIKVKKNQLHNELMEACSDNDLDKVKTIVESGIAIPEAWDCDNSPLFYAVSNNNLDITKYLLEHGLPAYDNSKGARKLHPDSELNDNTLAGIWGIDNHETIMYLITQGASINSHNIAYSPLAKVLRLEDRHINDKSDEFFNALLERDVDVDIAMTHGKTLLHSVVKSANSKYVPILVARSRNLEAHDGGRGTPLFSAISVGSEVGVNSLLEAGANPNAFLKVVSESALDAAVLMIRLRKGWNLTGRLDRIVENLKQHGAKAYQQLLDDGDISAK